MKSVTGKTSDQLLKQLPEWKQYRFKEFWSVGWRSGSKQQAVVSWERAIPDIKTADLVIERAKEYEKNCRRKNIPKTMAATWLNQARWEDVPKPKSDAVVDATYCGCGKEVAVLIPEPLCCGCYADKYSAQKFEGHSVPYKRVLGNQLKKMNLVPKNGETNESYWKRCRERLGGSLRLGSGRQEGLRQMVTGEGVHADSEGGG